MYIALYKLALEQFFKEMPHLKRKPTKELPQAYTNIASAASDGPECTRKANTSLFQALTNEDVIQQLKRWEDKKSSNAMFKSMMNYLHWVETILNQIQTPLAKVYRQHASNKDKASSNMART